MDDLLWRGSWLVYSGCPGPVCRLLVETLESLVGPTWEGQKGGQHYLFPRPRHGCLCLVGCLRAGGHGTVELSSVLAPSFPSVNFVVQRSSSYSQSQRRAMTTSGVALHRSIELCLQRAGQSSCSVYDGLNTTETARAYTQKRGLNEHLFANDNDCIHDKASIYAPRRSYSLGRSRYDH